MWGSRMQAVLDRHKSLGRTVVVAALAIGLLSFAPGRADASTSSERAMASYINAARTNHSRAALRFSDGLSSLARRHSQTMASQDRLYHNPYLAQWMANWSWRILGENVGVGPTVYGLHVAFMNSPPHKANIMDRRFRNVGVGIVSSNGRIWVTVIFRG